MEQNTEDEKFRSLEEKQAEKQPANEIEQETESEIGAIEQELLKLGISGEEIHIIRRTDPPHIKAKKRRLHQLTIFLSQKKNRAKGEHEHGYEESIGGEQKRLIKEQDKDIKRFMDFDHNRDRDGKLNSLGERRGNRSSFEKPIERTNDLAIVMKRALAVAVGIIDKVLGQATRLKQESSTNLQQTLSASQKFTDQSQAFTHTNQTAIVEQQQGAFTEHMNTSLAEHRNTTITEHRYTAIKEHSVTAISSPDATPIMGKNVQNLQQEQEDQQGRGR